MTDSINISAFKHFCDSQFSLKGRTKSLTDSRPNPQIPTWQIYEAILLGSTFHKTSFLQIDQFGREKEVRRFIGSKRAQVASDTEMPRVLSLMHPVQLRQLNYLIYSRAKQNGLLHVKDPLISHLRLGVVDGSCFKLFWAACFEILADPPLMLDFEPMASQGAELPASEKLVRRLQKQFGQHLVDLVLLDGLYVSHRHINQYLKAGMAVLIKTDEAGLNIIEDAEGLFNHWTDFKETVQYTKGVDAERLKEYEIWSADGFRLAGVEPPFKVARVKERNLKTGEEIIFWVLTTMNELSNEQMRELAHRRWSVENNGFKQFNEQIHTKRIWTHEEEVWLRLFWIQMTAFNLISLFFGYLERSGVKVSRLTRNYLRSLLLHSLVREYRSRRSDFN